MVRINNMLSVWGTELVIVDRVWSVSGEGCDL